MTVSMLSPVYAGSGAGSRLPRWIWRWLPRLENTYRPTYLTIFHPAERRDMLKFCTYFVAYADRSWPYECRRREAGDRHDAWPGPRPPNFAPQDERLAADLARPGDAPVRPPGRPLLRPLPLRPVARQRHRFRGLPAVHRLRKPLRRLRQLP